MSATGDVSAKPVVAVDPVAAAGDDERRRVARELHDDIGQRLAILADDADRLRRDLKVPDGEERRRLDDLAGQARALCEDLRRISHLLHPAIVDDLGLVKAIRSLAHDFTDRAGLKINLVDFEIPQNLPPAISTALYRIAQEALRNVAKHAGKAAVRLQLSFVSEELVLVVSDSGPGFETANEPGLGFTSMRERAQLVGGTLTIHSVLHKGTVVQATLPFSGATSKSSGSD